MKKFFLLFFMLTVRVSILAVTNTWDGSGGTNWGTAASWSLNHVPLATEDVVIPDNFSVTVDVAAVCATLTLNAGGNDITVSISAGQSLTVTGAVTMNAGTGNGDNRTIAVGSGTLSCALLTMGNPSSNNDLILSISTGTVNITGDITMNGSNTENSVTFTGAGILNVGGSITGGNLTESTGTVNYNKAGNQSVRNDTYYNLILSGSGEKRCNSGDITVNGKMSLQGTATFVISGPGNDLNFNSVAALEYKGSSAQTTTDEEFVGSTSNLIIDNSAGVTLHEPRTINGTLTLTNGILTTTTTNLLTIGTSGGVSGGSSSSFVNGPMSHTVASSVAQVKTYPIGKGSAYRPITLNVVHSNNNNTTYRAEVFNLAPDSRTLPGTLTAVSSIRYWNITKSGTGTVTSASVVLNYGSDDGVSDATNLRIAKQKGTEWENIGGTGSGSPTGSILSTVSFNEFSDFVLANASGGSNPLPVELTSFTASLKNYSVQLSWETATEVSNYGFEVERSADNENWGKIAFVEGHGNSNSTKKYTYTDSKISLGKYYYRLKQIDNEGTFTFSKEIEVITAIPLTDFTVEQNFPNPFNPTTTIKFGFQEPVNAQVVIYNAVGAQVAVLFNEPTEAGKIYSVDFDGSQFASGIYYYVVTGGNFKSVKKMILMK